MGKQQTKIKAVVIGASAGGINAILALLKPLPADYGIPIVFIQHISALSGSFWIQHLNQQCSLIVKEAEEKERLQKGKVYIAPPNYHLLIEKDETITLSVDEKINFSRPSIDVLFESASEAFKESLVGIILTGFGKDGSKGIRKIKENGGIVIAQDPDTAENKQMPQAAIDACPVDHILPLKGITDLLIQFNQ